MTGNKNKDNFNDNSRPPQKNQNRKACESYVLAFMFMAGSLLGGYKAIGAHESLNDMQDNRDIYVTEIKEQFRSSCTMETENINIGSPSLEKSAERCMTEKATAQLGEEFRKIQEKKEKWLISGILLCNFSIAMFAAGRHYGRKGGKNTADPKP